MHTFGTAVQTLGLICVAIAILSVFLFPDEPNWVMTSALFGGIGLTGVFLIWAGVMFRGKYFPNDRSRNNHD